MTIFCISNLFVNIIIYGDFDLQSERKKNETFISY